MNLRTIQWKKRRNSLLRLMLPFMAALIFIAVPAVRSVLPAEGGDSLYVSIMASVKWEETIPDVRRDSGHVSILISGTMNRNDAASPTVSKKGGFFRPVLNYTPQAMTITYIYSDSSQSIGPLRPGECEDRVPTEHHGTIFGDGKLSASLSVNMLSSMAEPFLKNLTPSQKQFAAKFQQSDPMAADWYQFAIAGPGRGIIPGSAQGPKPSCEMLDDEIRAPQFSLGLQMQLPPSGVMEGSRRWSAGTEGPPSLKIGISDVNRKGFSKPLNPEEGGKKNVTYSVSWYLGERRAFPGEEKKDDKKDCTKIAERMKMIQKILEAYSDPLLREEIKSKCGDGKEGMKEYQEEVEKRVMNEVPRKPGETPPPSKDLLWTTPFTIGPNGPVGEVTINGEVGGAKEVLITYDGSGNEIDGDYDSIEEMLTEWENTLGEDAGRILFNAALAHEKVHVSQFTDPDRGVQKTIDDLADYELEAFAEEMDYLMREYADMGCP